MLKKTHLNPYQNTTRCFNLIWIPCNLRHPSGVGKYTANLRATLKCSILRSRRSQNCFTIRKPKRSRPSHWLTLSMQRSLYSRRPLVVPSSVVQRKPTLQTSWETQKLPVQLTWLAWSKHLQGIVSIWSQGTRWDHWTGPLTLKNWKRASWPNKTVRIRQAEHRRLFKWALSIHREEKSFAQSHSQRVGHLIQQRKL